MNGPTSRAPPNTFRPIQTQGGMRSPPEGQVLSPPPGQNKPKLELAWRQGSDNWSSTGSSRPGSGAGPPTPDTLTGRRAAFRSQKWSHSFDQTSASPGVLNRRQLQQPLSLDSGYPGSPPSGLTWTDSSAPNIQTAKRELAGLMAENVSLPPDSGSLPSFPDIFQSPATSTSLRSHFYSYPPSYEGLGAQEDLDELDKEITEIVEQAAASGGLLRQISEENLCLKPRAIKTNSLQLSPAEEEEKVMVAVISTAEHSFQSAVRSEEQEENFYSSSVTTSTNLFPSTSVSASPASPALPLVVTETSHHQPAGFKRTAQFSSESSLTFLDPTSYLLWRTVRLETFINMI